MQLHSRELGQGRPLVMLHGLFGSSDNWLGVAPKLALNFRLFLLDLRNHGLSPHDDVMNYSAMAGDVAEFMDAQKLDRACLLGHSLGGKVAMQFALNFPARVEKLIVVDIAPRAYAPEHDKIFAALLALDLGKFKNRQEIEDALAPEIPDLALRRFLLKNLRSHGFTGARAVEWKINLPELFKNYPNLCEAITSQAPFSKPALFLRGGQSNYVSETDAPLIHNLFPAAKTETIDHARHWVHADAPEEFVRCVSAFLSADYR